MQMMQKVINPPTNFPEIVEFNNKKYKIENLVILKFKNLIKNGVYIYEIDENEGVITIYFKISVGLYEDYFEIFEGAKIKIHDKNGEVKDFVHDEIIEMMKDYAYSKLKLYNIPNNLINFIDTGHNQFENYIEASVDFYAIEDDFKPNFTSMDFPIHLDIKKLEISIPTPNFEKSFLIWNIKLSETTSIDGKTICDIVMEHSHWQLRSLYQSYDYTKNDEWVKFYIEKKELMLDRYLYENFDESCQCFLNNNKFYLINELSDSINNESQTI